MRVLIPRFLWVGMVTAAIAGHLLARAGQPPDEAARTVDSAGGAVSNAAFRCFAAIGQPCPVGDNAATAWVNASGFLQSHKLAPDADADRDGIADEDDTDDDGDGLDDSRELAGVAFDPLTSTDPLRADTDGDGAADDDESAAGTNPRNAGSLLAITGIAPAGDGAVAVTWLSREGRRYDLLSAGSPAGLASNSSVVTSLTATDGTGTWHEAVSTGVAPAPAGEGFYRVKLSTP